VVDTVPDLTVLALAVVLDLAMGELPARFHPTVWMGRTVAFAEKLAPRNGTVGVAAGGVLALLVAGLWAAVAYLAVRGLHGVNDVAYVLVGAVLLKSTFSLRMLHRAAAQVGGLLSRGEITQARYNLRSLVSRDTSRLSPEQASAAPGESVSENMADSFVGPWLFFALFGLPGAVAYRVINTLDSMIGYHGEYEYLGKASARLDDLLNLIPARLTGLLLVLGSLFLPGQRARGAWCIMWRDHSRTESPNAGWAMSGMAGALGVELEKTGHYRLGDSTRPVEVHDITQAVRSMYLVAGLGLLVALGLTLLRHGIF
jgi:adenosylcobinamide-phosphate synthase